MTLEYFKFLYQTDKDEWSEDNTMLNQLEVSLLPLLPHEGLHVLDIGCGRNEKYMKLFKGHSFLGVDGFDNDVFPDGSFIKGDFLTLDLEKRFDLILDNGCLHHQEADLLGRYVKKVSALLKKDGLFSCCVWASPFHRKDICDQRNNHFFDKEKFTVLVSLYDLNILSFRPFIAGNGHPMNHVICEKVASS